MISFGVSNGRHSLMLLVMVVFVVMLVLVFLLLVPVPLLHHATPAIMVVLLFGALFLLCNNGYCVR